jgi:hypothetical protein
MNPKPPYSHPAAPNPGLYRHFKGGLYTVEGVVYNTAPGFELQPLVLYTNTEGTRFVRPLTGPGGWFTSTDNPDVPRYVPVPE